MFDTCSLNSYTTEYLFQSIEEDKTTYMWCLNYPFPIKYDIRFGDIPIPLDRNHTIEKMNRELQENEIPLSVTTATDCGENYYHIAIRSTIPMTFKEFLELLNSEYELSSDEVIENYPGNIIPIRVVES